MSDILTKPCYSYDSSMSIQTSILGRMKDWPIWTPGRPRAAGPEDVRRWAKENDRLVIIKLSGYATVGYEVSLKNKPRVAGRVSKSKRPGNWLTTRELKTFRQAMRTRHR